MLDALNFFWKSWLIFVLAIIIIFVGFAAYQSFFIDSQYLQAYQKASQCNVAVIPIAGTMGIGLSNEGGEQAYTSGKNGDLDTLLWKLETAKNDEDIKSVMLQVDSYGGYGSVGEILSNYLANYPKPVVSYIREAGLSNAYWSILPSSYIVAHRTSSVGSIGVTMSYVSQAKRNKEEGLDYVQLSSGKYKDAGSPDKELTEEERAYYVSEIQKFAQVFKDDVVKYRGLSTSSVKTLADGRSFMGQEAVGLGLIDEVGDENTVLAWLDNNVFTGEGKNKAILCQPTY